MPVIQPPYGEADKKINAYSSPLKVSPQDTPGMTVQVRAGSYFNGLNVFTTFPGGSSPTIQAPVGGAKWTIVTLSNTGTIHSFDGVVAANPDFPVVPAGELPLAAIYTTPTTTAITASAINDIRPFLRTTDIVPNITTVIASLPTTSDVQGMLLLKADTVGTPSSAFALNNGSVTDQAYATLTAKRPTATDVGIRWNESATHWEFTNDGATWNAIASGALATATQMAVTSTNTNATYYPTFVSATTGNLPFDVSSGLSFNPSTNVLSAAGFVGSLTGTASSATVASNIAGGGVGQIPYQTAAGATAFDVSDLIYNAGTNTLSVTNFAGNFIGNLTGNISGNAATATAAADAGVAAQAHVVIDPAQPNITSLGTLTGLTVTAPIVGSVTGSAATQPITTTVTNATYYPTFVSATTGNLPEFVATGLMFNPSTNVLTTTTFTGALSGNATTATTATNIAGGLVGQVPFQSAAGTTVFDASTDMVYTAGTNTFNVANYTGTSLVLSGSESSVWKIVPSTGRAVNTTAAAATATIAANISSTYIATPAAAINVTLAAPSGDGERRRIVFGSATTVTWTPTAPATATTMKTAFAAGEAIEIYYNSVAGTPANSAATTWYPY